MVSVCIDIVMCFGKESCVLERRHILYHELIRWVLIPSLEDTRLAAQGVYDVCFCSVRSGDVPNVCKTYTGLAYHRHSLAK